MDDAEESGDVLDDISSHDDSFSLHHISDNESMEYDIEEEDDFYGEEAEAEIEDLNSILGTNLNPIIPPHPDGLD